MGGKWQPPFKGGDVGPSHPSLRRAPPAAALILANPSRVFDQDLLGEMTIPAPLKDHPSFAFLNKRLELALQSAAAQ